MFDFLIFSIVATPVSTINMQTTEQRGQIRHQFLLLSKRLEELRKIVLVLLLFIEFDKVVRWIHKTDLPHENALDLVAIHYSTTNFAYSGNTILYKSFSQEDPSLTFGNVVSAGTNVWVDCKLVLNYSKAGAQSRKIQDPVEPILPNFTVGVTSAQSDVQQAELESPFP